MGVADANELWRRVLEYLANQVPAEAFETWLVPTKALEFRDQTLVVGVPNQFFIDWIGQYYANAVEEACHAVLENNCQVVFRAGGGSELPVANPSRKKPLSGQQTKLQEHYTFQTFVVAECNQFAWAAAKAVAEAPGSKYNPLLIYGGVGLGKTHLIQAIGNSVAATRPGARVYYTPAEALFTELIMAIQQGNTMDFKRKYRAQDLLLIDDVHYLVGKERLQEEVFHIFNHLQSQGKQVVFTSDRPVKEIPTLEERLSSRLTSGLVADLQPPDLETRTAILKRKATLEHFDLPQDVALYIASRVKSNVRQLEGCLIRVIALASMNGHQLTLELAARALKDLITNQQSITRDAVLRSVCEAFGVTAAEIRGRTRTQRITLARQVAMYLYRTVLELSLKEIGSIFGGKDHTTVMYSIARIQDRRKSDPAFDERISSVMASLAG